MKRLAAPILIILTLLAYSNSFTAGFTLDNRFILRDDRVHSATAEHAGQIVRHTYWWPYGESGLYRPLVTFSYLFNYAILGGGENPAGYHWFNFVIHAINVLLLWLILRRLLESDDLALYAAMLWAVHPVLTEAVTNMVGRADMLAAFALLGGWYCYLRLADEEGIRRGLWCGGLAAIAMVGVFCKENAVVLPAVLALYEFTWWRERGKGWELALGCLATLPALLMMAWQRHAVFDTLPTTRFPAWDNPLVSAPFWQAKLSAIAILGRYLLLLVWPVRLSTDYSFNQVPLASGVLADWLAWIAVAAVAAAAIYVYSRNRVIFFFAGLAFLVLLPTSNLLLPIGTVMADRFLYVPAAAFAVVLVIAIDRVTRRPVVTAAVVAVLVLAFAGRTWLRNLDWHDNLTLTAAGIRTAPDSYKSHKLRAAAMFETDPAAHIDEVLAEAGKSLAILERLPGPLRSPETFQQAASYYIAVRDYPRARDLLRRAKSMMKDQAPAEVDQALAYVSVQLKDSSGALEAATTAVAHDPMNPQGYRHLAAAFASAGKPDDAAVALMEGALLTSDMGLRQQAISLYQQGLDPLGCALIPGPNGPALNTKCETVRRHTCAAAVAAIETYRRMSRPDLAARMQQLAIRDLGCK